MHTTAVVKNIPWTRLSIKLDPAVRAQASEDPLTIVAQSNIETIIKANIFLFSTILCSSIEDVLTLLLCLVL
jgi:hypothetical protein